MTDSGVTLRGIAHSFAFMAASSVLGLTQGRFLIDFGVLAFVVEVWSISIVADLVFAAGSVAAGAYAYRLALAGNRLGAATAGFLLNWLVYVASFFTLNVAGGDYMPLDEGAEMVLFVLQWGWVGLAFCALAPIGAARWLPSPDAPAVEPPASPQ